MGSILISAEPSVLLGRGLKIMENGEASFFDIDYIKPMIDHNFTVELVQKYVLDLNSHDQAHIEK